MNIEKIEHRYQYSNFINGATGSTMLSLGPTFLHSMIIGRTTTTSGYCTIYDSPTTGLYNPGTTSTLSMHLIAYQDLNLSPNDAPTKVFDCVMNNGLLVFLTSQTTSNFMFVWRAL